MTKWNRSDTDCKNEWAIFTGCVSFTGHFVLHPLYLLLYLWRVCTNNFCNHVVSCRNCRSRVKIIVQDFVLCQWFTHWVTWSIPGNTKLDLFRTARACETYTLFGTWFRCLQIICPVLNCPKIEQDRNFIEFWRYSMPKQRKLEQWMILCKS